MRYLANRNTNTQAKVCFNFFDYCVNINLSHNVLSGTWQIFKVQAVSTHLKSLRSLSTYNTARRVQLNLTLRFSDHITLNIYTKKYNFCSKWYNRSDWKFIYWNKWHLKWLLQTYSRHHWKRIQLCSLCTTP